MMPYTHVVDDWFGAYTEIINDPDLAALVESGEPVRFRIDGDDGDVWSDDYTVRTIRRAVILSDEDE